MSEPWDTLTEDDVTEMVASLRREEEAAYGAGATCATCGRYTWPQERRVCNHCTKTHATDARLIEHAEGCPLKPKRAWPPTHSAYDLTEVAKRMNRSRR